MLPLTCSLLPCRVSWKIAVADDKVQGDLEAVKKAIDSLIHEGIIGAIQHPDDGYVQPADLTQAFAKGARTHGAEIYRYTTVTAIEQNGDGWIVRTDKGDIAWGNQIRSYVFQPYTMVNDHRTELKVSDVHKVMDGDLDEFIRAYLKRFGRSIG
mgnify:CR=1 FL=1